MSASHGGLQKWAMVVLIGCVVTGVSGCGYLKNVRDDAMDCFILGAGVVVPVVPGEEENRAVGFLPPSVGVYLEATEFFHLGALFKASADVEWDRRAVGVVVDRRVKAGLGPLHHIDVRQTPILTNAYKTDGNQMDGWREHMHRLRDPVFDKPAKQLVFDGPPRTSWLHRGWQSWEVFALEVAIPEPFILHSGFNVRAGFDLSEVFDFALGLVGVDLYDDNAYTFGGELQHRTDGEGE